MLKKPSLLTNDRYFVIGAHYQERPFDPIVQSSQATKTWSSPQFVEHWLIKNVALINECPQPAHAKLVRLNELHLSDEISLAEKIPSRLTSPDFDYSKQQFEHLRIKAPDHQFDKIFRPLRALTMNFVTPMACRQFHPKIKFRHRLIQNYHAF